MRVSSSSAETRPVVLGGSVTGAMTATETGPTPGVTVTLAGRVPSFAGGAGSAPDAALAGTTVARARPAARTAEPIACRARRVVNGTAGHFRSTRPTWSKV
ncbi:hypothetical protein [Homoserinibacter gongjuensis]|uniref:hypothetical protein n=1 Tax=Homoserinibacter gongjuensis TaxID=1162968 RepID=UPI0024E17B6C|nr:hypothetical protein [Homoserinibacter gongjuensis]